MPRSAPFRFFLLTFLCSWGLWLLPAIRGLGTPLSYALYGLGGIAPSCVGIVLAYRKKDRTYWRRFWHRILSFRRIQGRGYWVILLFIPAMHALAWAADYLVTGHKPELSALLSYAADPVKLIALALSMLAFGPLAEELGWRGFALDHLEETHRPLISSLILGLFWAAWHLPLFLIRGTYQYGLLHESYGYAVDFLAGFFPMSVIMSWLFHKNKRSILSGILFHYSINFYGELIDLPNAVKPYRTLAVLISAIVILRLWKRDRVPIEKADHHNTSLTPP